jgi:hypothetical protein
MAKILSLVPTHGLEAVLVAVELVLESGVPSGLACLQCSGTPETNRHAGIRRNDT